ncbi:hypothetical protein B1R32_11746 [Abditibacterium utsteinense]|uniref:Uncharacterized protein n=1 Tax=Abditibacterium utsteinense TaxID=1960156 RepID=A0A2S8SQC3_9BACT|nr:hypothetical protein [Abditibacterium utsteinense]PQV63004.1 hypothetical protein B1R32_11746 [Abditibacterium utsteinense]
MSHSTKATRRRAAAQKMGLKQPVPRFWRAGAAGATGFFVLGYAGALGLSSLRFFSPAPYSVLLTLLLGVPGFAAALLFAVGAWHLEPFDATQGGNPNDSDLALLPNLLIWTSIALLFGLVALALFSNLLFTSLNALAPGWKKAQWTIAIPIAQAIGVVAFEAIGVHFALKRIQMRRAASHSGK